MLGFLFIVCVLIAVFSAVIGLTGGMLISPKYFFLFLLTIGGIFGVVKVDDKAYTDSLNNPQNIVAYAQVNSLEATQIELDRIPYAIDKNFVNKFNINIKEIKVGDIVKFTYTEMPTNGYFLTSIEKQ
jgi:hypothetical protein